MQVKAVRAIMPNLQECQLQLMMTFLMMMTVRIKTRFFAKLGISIQISIDDN